MTTSTNWPDPARPGVPMFPERSGRHHIGSHLLFWYSDIQQWVTVNPIRACKEPEDFAGDKYHGPVLTPAQIAEMLAGERERCAIICENEKPSEDNACRSIYLNSRWHTASRCSANIRNLGAAP